MKRFKFYLYSNSPVFSDKEKFSLVCFSMLHGKNNITISVTLLLITLKMKYNLTNKNTKCEKSNKCKRQYKVIYVHYTLYSIYQLVKKKRKRKKLSDISWLIYKLSKNDLALINIILKLFLDKIITLKIK